MADKTRVAVLYGGRSGEHEVSLKWRLGGPPSRSQPLRGDPRQHRQAGPVATEGLPLVRRTRPADPDGSPRDAPRQRRRRRRRLAATRRRETRSDRRRFSGHARPAVRGRRRAGPARAAEPPMSARACSPPPSAWTRMSPSGSLNSPACRSRPTACSLARPSSRTAPHLSRRRSRA